MKLISIVGNIGSGKTTLADEMSGELGCEWIKEAVTNNPYLELMYRDPRRWFLTMEMHLHLMMQYAYNNAEYIYNYCGEELKKPADRIFISDWGYPEVFVENASSDGHKFLTADEYTTFCHLREQVPIRKPDLIIWMDECPEVCYQRIIKRGRRCETGITLEYLKNLDLHYKDFLNSKFSAIPRIDLSDYTMLCRWKPKVLEDGEIDFKEVVVKYLEKSRNLKVFRAKSCCLR